MPAGLKAPRRLSTTACSSATTSAFNVRAQASGASVAGGAGSVCGACVAQPAANSSSGRLIAKGVSSRVIEKFTNIENLRPGPNGPEEA